MKKKLLFSIIFTFCIFIIGNLVVQAASENEPISSENKFRHAINFCPGGLAVGILAVNYEHFFNSNHGLVIRIDYESIPKNYSDAKIEASGVAFILNYRWHFSNEMNSMYLGAFARYRIYKGTGTLELKKFNFTMPDYTFGLNVGKRWVWKSGFNINTTFGYGLNKKKRNVTPTDPSIESAIDIFENGYDFMNPFLLEISIGYAF